MFVRPLPSLLNIGDWPQESYRIRANGRPADSFFDGLHLWLDASRITGLADGNSVARWDDLSGNGFHAVQATAAKKPVYKVNIKNGRPVVRFSDAVTGDLLVSTFSGALAQPHIVWLVALVNYSVMMDGIATGGRHLLSINAGQWRMYAGGDVLDGGTADANFHIFRAVFNGASSLLYVDGAQVLSGDAGPHTPAGLTFGNSWDEGAPMPGDIAEVVVYNNVPAATPISRLEQYLSRKYAITVS